MENEMEIAWPVKSWIHPNFLNYLKVDRMTNKMDEYIKEIGVTTDREFRIHELLVFCNNLTEEMAGELADGNREVAWVKEGDNYIVTFPKVCDVDRTCGVHIK